MPEPEEIRDVQMPPHIGDQLDARILDTLRAAMIDKDGSYLVIVTYKDDETGDMLADCVCVTAGEKASDRLNTIAAMHRMASERLSIAFGDIATMAPPVYPNEGFPS